jgi:hypothetical protein
MHFLLVLLGAVLALAGSVVVQWLIVPKVDRARRKGDRWERDVLALGEILSVEVAGALSGLRRALAGGTRLDDHQTGPEIQAASDHLATVSVRASWLITRIKDGRPPRIRVDYFTSAAQAFEAALIQYEYASVVGSTDMRQIDDDHDRARGTGRELLRSVEAIARSLGR